MEPNLRSQLITIFQPVVRGIAEMLGPDCEVLLHDLTKPTHSIVLIENGHISGRKVGDSIRGLVLNVIRSTEFKGDRLINYKFTTDDGKILKSSTMLIFAGHHEPIAALCINIDITRYKFAAKLLEDFCFTMELKDFINVDQEVDSNIKDILFQIIKGVVDDAGKPAASLTREEKISLVGFLDQKGVFLVKGAVEMVASQLRVSRFTIYNYLDEFRSAVVNSPNGPRTCG